MGVWKEVGLPPDAQLSLKVRDAKRQNMGFKSKVQDDGLLRVFPDTEAENLARCSTGQITSESAGNSSRLEAGLEYS